MKLENELPGELRALEQLLKKHFPKKPVSMGSVETGVIVKVIEDNEGRLFGDIKADSDDKIISLVPWAQVRYTVSKHGDNVPFRTPEVGNRVFLIRKKVFRPSKKREKIGVVLWGFLSEFTPYCENEDGEGALKRYGVCFEIQQWIKRTFKIKRNKKKTRFN